MGSVIIDIIEKAKLFATEAHNTSKVMRKYSRNPYIIHPQAVVSTLVSYTEDPEILAAAWLHDVIEDTNVTELDLRAEFGDTITDMVVELTPPSKDEFPDRKVRKIMENEQVKKYSQRAKLIKLADIFDNIGDVRVNDPEFAKIYLPEKLVQLELLRDTHDELWQRVFERVSQELSLLEELA